MRRTTLPPKEATAVMTQCCSMPVIMTNAQNHFGHYDILVIMTQCCSILAMMKPKDVDMCHSHACRRAYVCIGNGRDNPPDLLPLTYCPYPPDLQPLTYNL